MIPRRILMKGFLSYRDEQVLTFDGHSLWILTGPNGSGKSAIFDAVTFALFGHHRGGKLNARDLIHRGSDGLVVEFDFQLDTRLFRAKRTLKSNARGTRQISQWTDAAEWQAVPDTSAETGFSKWIREHIGLNYETFTSSVLLLQGQAEKLLSADPADRFKVLAGIVDLGRLQRLHETAEAKRRAAAQCVDLFEKQLAGVLAVRDDELVEAESRIAEADRAKQQTLEEVERIQRLEVEAEQTGKLQQRLTEVRLDLGRAEQLLEKSVTIDRDWRRVTELRLVLPHLETIATMQGRVAETQNAITQLETRQQDVANRLQQVEGRLRPLIQDREELRQSTARLFDEHEAAQQRLRLHFETDNGTELVESMEETRREHLVAVQQVTEAETLRREAKSRVDNLHTLAGTTECRLCGQSLTAEHIEHEQDLRKSEFVTADRCFTRANEALQAVAKTLESAKKRHDAATAQRVAVRAELIKNEATLCEILNRQRSKLQTQQDQIDLADAERRKAADALAEGSRQLSEHKTKCSSAQEVITCTVGSLPLSWREHVASITAENVSRFQSELRELEARGVENQARALEGARGAVEFHRRQMADLEHSLTAFSEAARSGADVLRKRLIAARQELSARERVLVQTREEQSRLLHQKTRRAELEEQARAADRCAVLYRTLSELLGRKGLQLHQVRKAERGIIDFANQVLDRLSSGRFFLRLCSDSDQNSDQAFHMEALDRQSGEAFGLSFLSGSQKFRVAVSLALGIGQYASRGHRPIESVIIDEGFGCLDREGRQIMIQELQNLRTQLRCILLVSHQEEFAEAFAEGYRVEMVDDTSRITRFPQ